MSNFRQFGRRMRSGDFSHTQTASSIATTLESCGQYKASAASKKYIQDDHLLDEVEDAFEYNHDVNGHRSINCYVLNFELL